MEQVAKFVDAYRAEHGGEPLLRLIGAHCGICPERARQLLNKIERYRNAPHATAEFAAKRHLAANFFAVLPLIEQAARDAGERNCVARRPS